jgi:DHA1 family bicyclomycin/chloramphenicol resistance-like MFS transporter
MLRPDTFALTALLALLTAIGPLSVDLYLPSLPAIGAALDASPAAVGLTVSFYLVGFAAGQVAYGPLSDRHGRRPVMFAAMLIYCAATIVCALAPTIQALIAARALQAFGSSGAVVLARAVVRDLYDGPRAGRELSLMGTIMGLAPIVAPLIGSGLQAASGWRACFFFLVLAGLAAAVAVRWLLPETLRKRERVPSSGMLASIAVVARHRGALAYIGMIAGGYGGLFAFISGSPFVLQSVYALDPFGYAVAFAIASAGYIAGAWLAAKLVTRLGLDRTIGWGVLCFAVAGAALVLATALAPHALAGFVAPMTLYLFGLGLAMPQALAGALQPFPERAGAASSLLGFLQQVVGSSAGILVGQMLGGSALPLALIIASMGSLALALALVKWSLRPG